MTDWLDYFMKRRKGPEINQPVSVGDPMKDLRAPLPEKPLPTNERRWHLHNMNRQYRRWMNKERPA